MLAFASGFLLGALAAAAAGAWALARRRRVLGNFLAFALHELNTPLTAINMTVLNFLSGVFGPVSPDQNKWMELLRTQISRLTGISAELRDIIHYELKKDLAASCEKVFLPQAVEQALDQIRRGISGNELSLEVDVPQDLPAVRADPDRLPRTVLSLVFHARKFRVSGPISISGARRDGRVELKVSYMGQPLAPGEADASLDLFYPGRRAKDEKLCAVGLGLGALRVLTRAQGGELEFHCDGQGRSQACLVFPAAGSSPQS